MSIVLATLDGERASGLSDAMALKRITDAEIRMDRALEMYLAKKSGVPVNKIARKYRVSRSLVYAEIKALEPWQKERAHAIVGR